MDTYQVKLFGESCELCGEELDQDEIHQRLLIGADGTWCEECEYYNYFNHNRLRPQLKIFYEDPSQNQETKTPKLGIKLKKRLSPLRYPGGKSKLAEFIANQLRSDQSSCLVSPFAGGASVELALLEANLVGQLILNDLDTQLINMFECILENSENLIDRILNIPVTHQLYELANQYVNEENTYTHGLTTVDKAFYYLINNRCSFSGIYCAGRMGGKKGSVKQLTQRYSPKDLAKRIRSIASMKSRISLSNIDAMECIVDHMDREGTTLIIDPPYVLKAPKLYKYHYSSLDQHFSILFWLNQMWWEFPGADCLVFYDNCEELKNFRWSIEDSQIINRIFSIAY